jgi:hypothetical protein
MKPCKRGNVAARDRFGHCLCVDCKAYRAEYQRSNRKAYKAEWQRRNRDKVRGYQARYKAAHPEKRAATVQSWRDRNPEKVAAMWARAGRKWASNNKGRRNASVKARQYAKRRAMPSWADRDALAMFYVEAERLTLQTGVPHEVDHIVPLQSEFVCGLHVPANLRVIPRSTNRSKRNRFEVGPPCAF